MVADFWAGTRPGASHNCGMVGNIWTIEYLSCLN